MSDTPRTDANITWKFDDKAEPSEFVDARLARQLERENAELRKDAERYRWIRTAGAWESEIGMQILSENPEKFDLAVDAARSET